MMMQNVRTATINADCILVVVDACQVPEKASILLVFVFSKLPKIVSSFDCVSWMGALMLETLHASVELIMYFLVCLTGEALFFFCFYGAPSW